MAISGHSKNNLNENENAECGQGKKQRIPENGDFPFNPLLSQPEKEKEKRATFERENCPRLDCPESHRPEHQQPEGAEKQGPPNLAKRLSRVRHFLLKPHESILFRQPG